VSPRRLTGAEEAALVKAAKRLRGAESVASERMRERDRLIADLVETGARVADVADVLHITRNAVYDAIKRVEDE
jgi:transcriptional regulator with GAF, ATPase, and Fis domain